MSCFNEEKDLTQSHFIAEVLGRGRSLTSQNACIAGLCRSYDYKVQWELWELMPSLPVRMPSDLAGHSFTSTMFVIEHSTTRRRPDRSRGPKNTVKCFKEKTIVQIH